MAIGEALNNDSVTNCCQNTGQKLIVNRFTNLITIPINDQIIELQTIIRDK